MLVCVQPQVSSTSHCNYNCLPPTYHILLIIRLPPISTLFPYTTLFRSHGARDAYAHHLDACLERVTSAQARDQADAEEEDRKSTRLNSSHSQISYAVFCLKKKNHKFRVRIRSTYKCLLLP